MGARGRDSKLYRGEVFTASGTGAARITSFSPNRVEVEVSGAQAGDRLVLNQNFDPGWRAGARAAEPYQGVVSAPLSGGSQRVVFSFWPRGFTLGLVTLAVTLAGLAALYWRRASAARFRP